MSGPVPPRGRGDAAILDPARAARSISVGRRTPGADLAPYVDYLWWVRWHAEPAYVSQVLAAPVVHLSAEPYDGRPRLLVNGVQTTRFERRLVGEGHVVAAAFRPGCFRPILRARVSSLTGRVVPAADLLGRDDRVAAQQLLEPGIGDDDLVAVLEDWLQGLGAQPDPVAEEVAALVGEAEREHGLVRAEQLADLAGVSLRTLQRRFGEYVGIGPKWVVQRCRLLDVASAAHSTEDVDWAGLAARLGFADQAHLVRSFTAVVGRSPAAYVRGLRSQEPEPPPS